ncbi:unnamed protein product [Caenorhabditis sp. 36 PRJEB53466]|nr:unnamed protein product [Caenorhabditis sp. 36 PRJEB53466]
MAKRGRKRQLKQAGKENAPPTPPKPTIDRMALFFEETEWMPSAAVDFYNEHNDIEEKLKNIESTTVLVGPFRKLRGETNVSGVELIMLDRESTDLPEMQTFMRCAAGRYAFWRDTPTEKNPVIVFVDLKTVPEVTVIGNKVEHAILHFCEKFARFGEKPTTPKKVKIETLGLEDSELIRVEKEMSTAIRNRKTQTVGGISGPGLVLVNNKSKARGYRDLTRNPNNVELLLRSLRLVGLKEHEQRIEAVISALMGEVQICNDEGDFGNGLELGHLLFLANKQSIKDNMLQLLMTAYKLLGRKDFLNILLLTLENRELPFSKCY